MYSFLGCAHLQNSFRLLPPPTSSSTLSGGLFFIVKRKPNGERWTADKRDLIYEIIYGDVNISFLQFALSLPLGTWQWVNSRNSKWGVPKPKVESGKSKGALLYTYLSTFDTVSRSYYLLIPWVRPRLLNLFVFSSNLVMKKWALRLILSKYFFQTKNSIDNPS